MITTPRSNIGIKVKSTKPQAYESKKERKQTHQRLFTQFGPTWPNLEERLISPILYQRVLTKRYKWVQEISTRAHKEQNLISTNFPNLTNEQDTQWCVYNVSQPKRTSLHRPSTLKFPPLQSQVSLSWSSLSFTSKNELKHLNST